MYIIDINYKKIKIKKDTPIVSFFLHINHMIYIRHYSHQYTTISNN